MWVAARAQSRVVQAALGPLELVRSGAGRDRVSVPPGGPPRGQRRLCRHRPRPSRRSRIGPAAPAARRRPARPSRRQPRAFPGQARPRRPPALLDRQAFGRLPVVTAGGHRQDHAQLDLAGPLLGPWCSVARQHRCRRRSQGANRNLSCAPGSGRRAALVAGASFSHHAQGGGIWPDGAGMPDPPAASAPPTNPAPEPTHGRRS
jgi:hypothetical protein